MQINPATQLLLPLQTLRRKNLWRILDQKIQLKSIKRSVIKICISSNNISNIFSDWKFNIDAQSIDIWFT